VNTLGLSDGGDGAGDADGAVKVEKAAEASPEREATTSTIVEDDDNDGTSVSTTTGTTSPITTRNEKSQMLLATLGLAPPAAATSTATATAAAASLHASQDEDEDDDDEETFQTPLDAYDNDKTINDVSISETFETAAATTAAAAPAAVASSSAASSSRPARRGNAKAAKHIPRVNDDKDGDRKPAARATKKSAAKKPASLHTATATAATASSRNPFNATAGATAGANVNANANTNANANANANTNADTTATTDLLSPESIAEAKQTAKRLLDLSKNWIPRQDEDGNDLTPKTDTEEFYATLQVCRSSQTAVVSALEQATMMTASATSDGEIYLAELLELNETLLGAISGAELSVKLAEKEAAAKAVKAEQRARRIEEQRMAVLGPDDKKPVEIDPAVRAGLPPGYFDVIDPHEYNKLCQPQNYKKEIEADRKKDEKKKAAAEASAATTKQKEEHDGATTPKKTKKKRIRKKKNKAAASDGGGTATDAGTKDKVASAAELARIKAEELAALRLEEEAAAEKAEKARQAEKDRMAKMREEVRRQQAAAREKKKEKKARKYERRVAEKEQEIAARDKIWRDEISREQDYTEVLYQLCTAELIRQSRPLVMGLTVQRVEEEPGAKKSIIDVCRKAYASLYKNVIKCRVVVADTDNADLNGREGTILHYDADRGEYCVGLDTKKGKKDDVHFFKPRYLGVPKEAASKAKKSRTTDHSYGINLPNLVSYGGVQLDLDFLVSESDVAKVKKASSLAEGLASFMRARDEEELRRRQEEEEEKAREEEDRKRRAELRAKEQKEWEERKASAEREKARYAAFIKEQRKRQAAGQRQQMHHPRYNDSDDDEYEDYEDSDFEYDDPAEAFCRARMRGRCNCEDCRMRNLFAGLSGGGIPINPVFAAMFGGIPGMFYVDDDDEEAYSYDGMDEEDFFRRFAGGGMFDDAWERQEEERKQAENEEMAEILGVPVDADAKTIKTKYRRMALQYHPDKWSADSAHGMSREDAEEQFKSIQSAYDHMMTNFDED